MWKTPLVVIGLALSAPLAASDATVGQLDQLGQPIEAPELLLPDIRDRAHDLKAYRGRVVLVNFWATWCPPCIVEMPGSLGEAIEEMEKDEVIAEALGDHVYSHYLEAKREEWDAYNMQISQWELDRYLEAY